MHITAESSGFVSFLLAQIRVDAIAARLRAEEISEVGFSLSIGAISAADAVADLLNLGCSLTVLSSIVGASS